MSDAEDRRDVDRLTEPDPRDKLAEFRQVSVAEARQHLADIVNCAHYGQERIVITRRGKPVAVLVPPEDIELLVDIEDMVDLELAEEARQRIAAGGETIPWEQLKQELGW